MEHTQNYQLNQYEPGDSFLRTDFNEDNQRVEAAILTATPVFGTYTGNSSGTAQVIHLGFCPKAVLILPYTRTFTDTRASLVSMFFAGENLYEFKMLENGFQVNGRLNTIDEPNSNSYFVNPYRYIAWR